MKNILIALVVLVVLVGGYYAVSRKSTAGTPQPGAASYQTFPSEQAKSPQPASPAPAAAPVASALSSISIQNFAFGPGTVTVKAGTKVTWTNHDSAPHTVTSDSGSTLNSANLSTGQSYSFTFTTPGTYTYHCTVHPMMKGVVIVTS